MASKIPLPNVLAFLPFSPYPVGEASERVGGCLAVVWGQPTADTPDTEGPSHQEDFHPPCEIWKWYVRGCYQKA